ncbi:MAG: hypothetical protein HYV09_07605 [Deltaproteobacteria bacterium]|nr:hypothetical protein [Deltaproteobacteria bacterium]
MSGRGVVVAVFLAFAASSSVGCAVASDDVGGMTTPRKKDASTDGGDEEEDTGSDEDTGSSSPDTGSSTADTGGGGGTDTGGGGGDSGAPCTTLGSTECMSSVTDLGSVSGDKGSDTKAATGSDSKFLRIRVTEDDSSLWSGVDLTVRFTLTSVTGNFDLYVYEGKTADDGGGVECTTIKDSSTNASGDDVVSLKWSDNRPIGGHDDARVISVEVRATDASCAGASWSLFVEGNK